MTGKLVYCRHCGAPFMASATGATVHCPRHRTAESRKQGRRGKYPPIECSQCGTVHTTLRCSHCGF